MGILKARKGKAIRLSKSLHRELKRSTLFFVLAAVVFPLAVILAPLVARAGITYISACGNLIIPNETYILTQDVTSDKTCFVIKADGVVLDLNGHTVTYANAPEVGVNSGFEQGTGSTPTGWDLSAAPQASRVNGPLAEPITAFTGTHSLRFDLGPGAQPQSVQTSSSVTLAADTTYALTAMVHNTMSDSVNVTVSLDGTAYTTQQNGITWRGFQLIYVIFRPSAPVTAPLKVSVSGGGLTSNGNVHVDDVAVRPARYYGVAIPTYNNQRLPDIDVDALPSGNPDNITVKNGTFLQGAGNPFEGHTFYLVEGAFDFELDGITATVQGPESSIFHGEWSRGNTLLNNTFISNVEALVSRDNFSAAMINMGRTYGNLIHHNTLLNGPHAGIMMGDFDGSSPGGSQIYNNIIRMKSRHTNGFAIAGGDRNGLVHDNTILNVDGYYGRGIHAGNGARFYNNHVEVSDIPTNQEYDGCQPPGVYGLQAEEGEGTEVTNNIIVARTGTGLCNAMALRFTSPVNNVLIQENTVTAVDADSTDSYRAYVASYSRGDDDPSGNMSGVPLLGNTFTSNSAWFYFGNYGPSSINNVHATGNTFTLGASPTNFIAMHGVSTPDVLFVDNVYGSPEAKAALENDSIRWSGTPDANSDFTMAWTYNPTVRDAVGQVLSGATVTITRGATPIATGTTGADGKLATAAVLPEFINDGGVETNYGGYSITIAKVAYDTYQGTLVSTEPNAPVITLQTTESGGESGCQESWTCGSWGSCVDGTQSRTCTDANACGTVVSKPAEAQACSAPPCTENWSCSGWSSCIFGNQTRVCTDANVCGTTAAKPVESQSCTAPCDEQWVCGSWSACSSNTQTRACTDVHTCGTTTSKPAESQACGTPPCTESWSCTGWSACSSGSQTRTCTDANSCGTVAQRPAVAQACTDTPPPGPTNQNTNQATNINSSAPATNTSQPTGGTDEDTTPPASTITSSPPAVTSQVSPWFSITGTDDAAPPSDLLYSYRLNDGSWSTWTSKTTITFNDLPNGKYTFQLRSQDAAGNIEVPPETKSFTINAKPIFFVAPPVGSTIVRLYDSALKLLRQFSGGAAASASGVNVSAADVGGSSQEEVLTIPAAEVNPRLRVYSQNGKLLASKLMTSGGKRVAAKLVTGDVNGDRKADAVVATNSGINPRVVVFEYVQGQLTQRASFTPYLGRHPANIQVAVGDVDGDGVADIVTIPGAGVSPQVRVFSGTGKPKASFYAYGTSMKQGVQILLEDVDRDGTKEIITVPNPGGAAQVIVRTLHGRKLAVFHALPRTSRIGVSIAVADVDGDGKAEIITVPKQGTAPRVSVYSWQGRLKRSFRPFPTAVRGSISLSTVDHDGNGTYSILTSIQQGGRSNLRQFSGTGQQQKLFSAPGSAVGNSQ